MLFNVLKLKRNAVKKVIYMICINDDKHGNSSSM